MIFEKAKKFINLFCSLGATRMGYLKSRVTPYMHALVYHVPMFMKKYKNFKQFTGQGVEKNNDDANVFFPKIQQMGCSPRCASTGAQAKALAAL